MEHLKIWRKAHKYPSPYYVTLLLDVIQLALEQTLMLNCLSSNRMQSSTTNLSCYNFTHSVFVRKTEVDFLQCIFYYTTFSFLRPPRWSRGQCVWLLIMRSRVRFPALPNFKCGLGLERASPSLVRTIGQLLDWEVPDLIKKVDIIRLDGG